MRRLATSIPILIIAALLLTVMPAAARAPIAIGVSNPDGGGPDVAAVRSAVYAHRAQVGRFPATWSLWSKWGDRGGAAYCAKDKGSCRFPAEAVEWLHSKGITPVVWWIPIDPKNWEAGKYERYKRILWGKHDGYIKTWARELRDVGRKTGKKTIVRFAHESLGTWFPWSVYNFDNSKKNFKQAWRRIWNKFKGVGAMPHTRFMWSQVWPEKAGYPGDRYVHFIGVTVLNFGSDRTWKPAIKAADMMARSSRSYSKKPIIFAETASHYEGGDKARWITTLYNRTYNKYPWVKAIIWLDTHPNFHPDWRLVKPDDGSALAAYRALANNPRFKGKIR